jgi:hypothetical protein
MRFEFGATQRESVMNTSTTKTVKTVKKVKPIAKATATKGKTAPSANSIRYRIMTRLEGSNEVYEATAEIPGFKATKVLRNDGSTIFTTRSALTKACRDRANALKRLPVFDLGTPTTKSSPRAKKVATFTPVSGACPVTGACASS